MFCPNCGNQVAPEANFCSACGKHFNRPPSSAPATRIVRPRVPRAIAGVCSGFALHYGWDVNLTRILFAVLTFFTFPIGVMLYIIAWVILPDAQYALPQSVPPAEPLVLIAFSVAAFLSLRKSSCETRPRTSTRHPATDKARKSRSPSGRS